MSQFRRVSAKQKRKLTDVVAYKLALAVEVRPVDSSIAAALPPWNSCHPAVSLSEGRVPTL